MLAMRGIKYATREPVVKKLLVLIIASMASSLVLYALVSKDQPARHSGLKVAELPPLVPLHDLFPTSDAAPDHATLFGLGTTVAWQQTETPMGSFGPRLTLPQTSPIPGPLPTVVLIDSDAAGVTGPDTAETVLFLANRGYAVLEIDCRSSINTGRAAVDVASGGVGNCTEITIADETRELIEQGIADPAALALLGSGSGGTLALLAMSTEPELFKAAVVHSPALYQTDHLYTGAVPEPLIHTKVEADVGAVSFDKPSVSLSGKSPIELIGTAQGALLMTHDNAEATASLDPAYARDLMASKRNVVIYDFDGGEHSYSRWQTRVQVARLTETFLARHLGGRNGGYDYIELLAKLF